MVETPAWEAATTIRRSQLALVVNSRVKRSINYFSSNPPG